MNDPAMKIKEWTEAARPKTLPVSVAGVLAGAACILSVNRFNGWIVGLAMAFAVLAQITSNFANEYFDYRNGMDREGRDGPRRGVTEGDITPRAMLVATCLTLGLACAVGLCLLYWGPWWMVPLGLVIAVGALAYSAGPWPLSHHGLGDVAVIVFFGLIPVDMVYYLCCGNVPLWVNGIALALGLMGDNILIVNNYRDYDDDRAVGKHTLAVLLGKNVYSGFYLTNALLATLLGLPWWLSAGGAWVAVPFVFALVWTVLFVLLRLWRGRALNRLLGLSSMTLLAWAVSMLVAC